MQLFDSDQLEAVLAARRMPARVFQLAPGQYLVCGMVPDEVQDLIALATGAGQVELVRYLELGETVIRLRAERPPRMPEGQNNPPEQG